ncbi:uncharacterized protein ARMOST_10907 [Armillaria ostoyae]|uniref:Uncharacterized protein n=1 Tax=Armillaria ostoyae TaxID=47428 RepID=A0A284RFM3_ARMOS|nr:uncharacterized protein ARMOST_10907 [Armillaria ostoyae]
MDAKYEFPET